MLLRASEIVYVCEREWDTNREVIKKSASEKEEVKRNEKFETKRKRNHKKNC